MAGNARNNIGIQPQSRRRHICQRGKNAPTVDFHHPIFVEPTSPLDMTWCRQRTLTPMPRSIGRCHRRRQC